ncbi:TM2 domain-containing protein Y66D12A.21, partial [Trichinella britovi]
LHNFKKINKVYLNLTVFLSVEVHFMLGKFIFFYCLICFLQFCDNVAQIPCDQLLPGQYLCNEIVLNPETDLPLHCDGNDKAVRFCTPIRGLNCQGLMNGSFIKSTDISCEATRSFRTALLLSVFFGWLGFDRLYLGYYSIGLFKMCTFGFFFLFHLIDIILIALQIVKPAGGGSYQMDAYGPKVLGIHFSNMTNIRPEN